MFQSIKNVFLKAQAGASVMFRTKEATNEPASNFSEEVFADIPSNSFCNIEPKIKKIKKNKMV
jgi:hypothetical protein